MTSSISKSDVKPEFDGDDLSDEALDRPAGPTSGPGTVGTIGTLPLSRGPQVEDINRS